MESRTHKLKKGWDLFPNPNQKPPMQLLTT